MGNNSDISSDCDDGRCPSDVVAAGASNRITTEGCDFIAFPKHLAQQLPALANVGAGKVLPRTASSDAAGPQRDCSNASRPRHFPWLELLGTAAADVRPRPAAVIQHVVAVAPRVSKRGDHYRHRGEVARLVHLASE